MKWDTNEERETDFALEHHTYDDANGRRWLMVDAVVVVHPVTNEIAVEKFDRREHGKGWPKRFDVTPPPDFTLDPALEDLPINTTIKIVALQEELFRFKRPDEKTTAWWYFAVWSYAPDRETAERAALAWFITHKWSRDPWA